MNYIAAASIIRRSAAIIRPPLVSRALSTVAARCAETRAGASVPRVNVTDAATKPFLAERPPLVRKIVAVSHGLYNLDTTRNLHQPVEDMDSVAGFTHISWIDQDGPEPFLFMKYDRGRKRRMVPYLWLRDSCHCSQCMNQDTMQRSLDSFSIPKDVKPKIGTILPSGLQIHWSHDNHVSLYDWEWLKEHVQVGETKKTVYQSDQKVFWDYSIKKDPPSIAYERVMSSDEGVAQWTAKIAEYGFCYVDGCPVSPEKTKELLERIAFIRETHYGGFYDFTSDLTMKDTAYTSLALGAHTDTAYFSEPAGLQAFHLLSHTEGTGGQSLLVDGFKAAAVLEQEDYKAFDDLTRIRVNWHSSGNEGITIQPYSRFPVIEITEKMSRGIEGQSNVARIRWNNDDRGTFYLYGDRTISLINDWYRAARKWDKILKRRELQYWQQLEPGRVLIFDNWRVLHGRSAFTGKRRMCGAYLNRDDFISRWRNTNFPREKILREVV